MGGQKAHRFVFGDYFLSKHLSHLSTKDFFKIGTSCPQKLGKTFVFSDYSF